MKNSDIVYNLVHSMDKSEKRHFKIAITKYARSRNKNSVQLFDLLNKMLVFNEQVLKDKWGKISTKNNLAYEKHQLQNQLLDFLEQYHKHKNDYSQMGSLIGQIELLKRKKQFTLANKLIERGIAKAKEVDDYCFFALFQAKKISLANDLVHKDTNKQDNIKLNKKHFKQEQLEDILETYSQIANDGFAISNYMVLYHKMTSLLTVTRSEENSKKLLKEIVNSPFFQDESKANSDKAKWYLYQLKSLYYQFLQEPEKETFYQDKKCALERSESL